MPMTQQHWPAQATDVADELRRQLDAAEATITELRLVLDGEAQAAAELTEAERVEERRSARFWYSAWTNAKRRLAQLQIHIAKLERWLLESGREAQRLQTDLDVAREQNGGLARQLAETEGDFTELVAERDELIGLLDRCECAGEAH